MDLDRKSPIVRILYWMIKGLRSWTPSSLFMRFLPKEKHDAFIEYWVAGSFLLSITLFFISYQESIPWWEWFFLIVAAVRMIEITIWVAWSLLFHGFSIVDDVDPGYLSGRRRIVVLLLLNYLEFIVWFALIYRILAPIFHEPLLNDPLNALKFSFVNNTGVGQTSILPEKPVAKLITLIQSIVGVLMALAVIARFISVLPEPLEPDKD